MSEKDLEKNLGLIETIAISMGSMIGSGIFILPGVAFMSIGNESVVLAFLLGGILTIPAALSAAELSTAIPESGGSYTYIERGMGPLMGTIAGVGNWMVLNFKTALALVGGIPYLVFIFPAIQEVSIPFFTPIVVISIVLTVLFTVVNAVSSASAGKLQNIIVVLMLIAIGMIMLASLPELANSDPRPVFNIGGGFIAATSLVFVSYAGVIKVTSVAEEIKNPGRNIPYGIIISLIITTFVYVSVTYIAVETVEIAQLANNVPIEEGGLAPSGEGAILAISAQNLIGYTGAVIIVIAAMLALASTANSGILSASRYPLAMARDQLANKQFGYVSQKTGTPIYSVLATGGAVIFMVTFLPVDSIARFGAAFQIIVFILVSISVIGFRESDPEAYDPEYLAPFYPYLQLFGLFSGLLLLSRIGALALSGSVIIVAVSVAYYYFYVKTNLKTEGSVKEELREDMNETVMNRIEKLLDREGSYKIMIVAWDEKDMEERSRLIDICETLSSHGLDIEIDIVEFRESIKTSFSEEHPDIEKSSPSWVTEYSNINYKMVDARNVEKSIVRYATYNDIDLIAHSYREDESRVGFVEDKLQWALENAPCDSIVIRGEVSNVEKVTILTDGSIYVPTKVLVADAIANSYDAHLKIINLVDNPAESRTESLEEYLEDIKEMLVSTASYDIIDTDDKKSEAEKQTSDSDVVVIEMDINTLFKRVKPTDIMSFGLETDKPIVFAYSDNPLKYQTLYRRILMKYLFRGLN